MRKSIRWFLVAMVAAVAVSCSNGKASPLPTVSASATIAASPSPTSAPFVLLMAPDAPKAAAGGLAVQAVEAFCKQEGLALKRVTPGNTILGDYLPGTPVLVAAVGSGFGQAIFSAAQANPAIRFVAIEENGVQPLPNLLVVGGDHVRFDQVAFLAGMLATIENQNEYVGWIGESGTARGPIYRNGFLHGARYICPRCRVFDFELGPSADLAAGIAAAGDLHDDYVDTASAVPSTAGDAALADLAKRGTRVAGAQPDFYQSVFSGGTLDGAKNVLGGLAFRPDLLLTDLLPRFLGGEVFPDAVSYSLENHGLEYAPFPNDWISPGRQAYLQSVLDDLASGRLDIGIDPQTGDDR
jgi:basic membrane lipoprotein Med (substrate-binding protein (PBP1-ABC) superfamily)